MSSVGKYYLDKPSSLLELIKDCKLQWTKIRHTLLGHFAERRFNSRVFNGRTLWSNALEGALTEVLTRWFSCVPNGKWLLKRGLCAPPT